MSSYEQKRWAELQEHWVRKAKRRNFLPDKAREILGQAGTRVVEVTGDAARRVGHHIPDGVKDAGETAADVALVPVIKSVVRLLDLVTEWVAELTDPQSVLDYHRAQGRDVAALKDLRGLDLEELDELTHRLALKWRTLGAAEGVAVGALALVPVAGGAVAITLDMLVMHVLSTSIATRVAYAYGFNATDPDLQFMVDRMVRRAYKGQAAKAKTLRDASAAFKDGFGRKRWSDKLRHDHQLMAAIERLMSQFAKGQNVPVGKVVKAMPIIAVAAGAGTNSYVLGDVARQAAYFAQTHFLAEKYGLPLPVHLMHERNSADAGEDEGDTSSV
jgi:hypothetical protein